MKLGRSFLFREVIELKNDFVNTLEASDLEIREDFEYVFEEQRMLFVIEPHFDVDKKLGVNTEEHDGVWINLYSTYNPITGEITIPYTVDADEQMIPREYIPTDEEKEVFRNAMEQFCEQRTNMTCREAYFREYVEDADEIILECVESGDNIIVRNKNDGFILHCEDKEGGLKNHIGHKMEIATYGGNQCIAIECTDCNEIMYDTDREVIEQKNTDEMIMQ